MLYYMDELMTAMNATPGRRRFNVFGSVLIILIGVVVVSVGLPALVLLAIFCLDLVVYLVLVVRWARKDALAAHRQGEREV